MTIEYPLNWQDCWLVLLKKETESVRNNKGELTGFRDAFNVVQFKPIVLAHNSEGQPLNFYGVKASKFGLPVGKATHWAICQLGVAEPSTLIQEAIPEASARQVISLNEREAIFFNRYNKNFGFIIGLKKEFRPKNKPSQTLQNEVFTVEESLELLYS